MRMKHSTASRRRAVVAEAARPHSDQPLPGESLLLAVGEGGANSVRLAKLAKLRRVAVPPSPGHMTPRSITHSYLKGKRRRRRPNRFRPV